MRRQKKVDKQRGKNKKEISRPAAKEARHLPMKVSTETQEPSRKELKPRSKNT